MWKLIYIEIDVFIDNYCCSHMQQTQLDSCQPLRKNVMNEGRISLEDGSIEWHED